MLKLLYFAWVRERTGTASEELELPDNVSTVADLIAALRAKGGGYTDAFESDDLVRVAVNKNHVSIDHKVQAGDEVAFFPPVTGG